MIAAVLASALLISTPALGQPACNKRGDVVDHLGKKYSETPVAMGLANNGGIVEVLASRTGETFTILISMPNGTSCLIAAGKGWEVLPVNPEGASM